MIWRCSGEYTIRSFRCLLTLTISGLPSLNTGELLSYYRTWGPCARACVMLIQGHLKVDQHRCTVSIAAAKFASDPHQLLGSITQFDSDEVSHIVSFVRLEKLLADSRTEIRAEIPLLSRLRGSTPPTSRCSSPRFPRIPGPRPPRAGCLQNLHTFD